MLEGDSKVPDNNIWDQVRDWLPWIPGVWAAFRVEHQASQAHKVLFDDSGQVRVTTIEDCEKCKKLCSEENYRKDKSLERELQNIHTTLASLQNNIFDLIARLKGN